MKNQIAIRLLLLILVAGALLPLSAQTTYTLSGTVYDSTGVDPLPGVRIVLQGTQQGVLSDEKGAFTISCDAEHPVVVFSLLGYEKQTFEMTPLRNTRITVVMSENPIEIGGITISSPTPHVFHHDYKSQVLDYAHLGENLLIVKLSTRL